MKPYQSVYTAYVHLSLQTEDYIAEGKNLPGARCFMYHLKVSEKIEGCWLMPGCSIDAAEQLASRDNL